MRGKRRNAIIGFGIFLGFMAICTIVSKGIYRSGLPKVVVSRPEQKSISHEIKGSGMVKQGQEYGIYVEEGLRVATILVRNGDVFEPEEPLFQIEMNDLQDKIEEKEIELKKAASQQKESKQNAVEERLDRKTATSRAEIDYKRIIRDADLKISRAREDYFKAEEKLKKYEQSIGQGTVSGGNNETAVQENLVQMKQELTQYARIVEDAILAKELALTTAERTIEDARNGEKENYSSASEGYMLDKEYGEKQLDRLKELRESDGWIYADMSGRVIEQRLAIGERTQDRASLIYAYDDGERILDAVITREEASDVMVGDIFKLKTNLPSGKLIEEESVVEFMESDGGNVVMRMFVENEEILIGQTMLFSITKQSEPYNMCIPMQALYKSEVETYYVFVIEEQEGILGSEWRARKIAVTVQDQNDKYAAIEAVGISEESKIVVSADKELEDGEVVRVLE